MSERRGSTTNPFHFDLLGSLRAVSNSGGTGTSEATLYEAFGNVVTGDMDWAGQTTGRPFGFVGGEQYQSDSESGLQLLGNRYYDPTIGRFFSKDPAESGNNWYAYASNSPTRRIDPLGLDDDPKKDPPKTPDPPYPIPGMKRDPVTGKPVLDIPPITIPSFPPIKRNPGKPPKPEVPGPPKLPGTNGTVGLPGGGTASGGVDPKKGTVGGTVNVPISKNPVTFFGFGGNSDGDWGFGFGWIVPILH